MDYGAHRRKHQELLGHLKSNGGSEEELEVFSEDFMRTVEDEMAKLTNDAIEAAGRIAKGRPALISKEEALLKSVISELKKNGYAYSDIVLEAAARHGLGMLGYLHS